MKLLQDIRIIAGLTFIILALMAFFTYSFTPKALGAITNDQGASSNRYSTYQFFASTTPEATNFMATTSSATSTNIIPYFDSNGRLDNGQFNIVGAKSLEYYFTRAAGSGSNQGSTIFTVQVSPDGVTWYNYSKLIQATSTTIQGSAAIAAATTTLNYDLDLRGDSWFSTRCTMQIVTDGSSTCAVTATF